MKSRKSYLACWFATRVIRMCVTVPLVLIALIYVAPQPAYAQKIYSVTIFPPEGTDTISYAFGVNDAGLVAGYSGYGVGDSLHSRAVIWQGGQIRDLGIGTSVNESATAVNNNGQVACNGLYGSYIWQNGVLTTLGTLPNWGVGDLGNEAVYGINASGDAVGQDSPIGADGAGTGDHAVMWHNDAMIDLGVFPPAGSGNIAAAEGINDSGVIVGYGTGSFRGYQGLVWAHGTTTNLGTFDGLFPDSDLNSYAYAINNHNQVIGQCGVVSGIESPHACMWQNGQIQDLGVLPNSVGNISEAYAINDYGQVVGTSVSSGEGSHAFIWCNGVMQDLNDLVVPGSGLTLIEAEGISLNGRIVGYGSNEFGQVLGFLLTPVAARNVSDQVAITHGVYLFNRSTGRYNQNVTVKNNSTTTIPGSVSLVLDNLSSDAALFDKSGQTVVTSPAGSPYINISTGDLTPGASTMVMLDFANPSHGAITYVTRVLSGPGSR